MTVRVPNSDNVLVRRIYSGLYRIGDGLFTIPEVYLTQQNATLCYRTHRALSKCDLILHFSITRYHLQLSTGSYQANVNYIPHEGFRIRIIQYRLNGLGQPFIREIGEYDHIQDDQLTFVLESNIK